MIRSHCTLRCVPESPRQSDVRGIELIARGVLVRDNHLLLCQPSGREYAYLPGGHVDPGESARFALAREFQEELAWSVEVGPLLVLAESSFRQGGKIKHEMNLVFHVEHASQAEPVSREEDIEFIWVAQKALASHLLFPAPLSLWLQAWLEGGQRVDPVVLISDGLRTSESS